jgi:DNA-binding protein YbaB
MDNRDREHFDELILKAVQSGKKETSGIILEFKEHIKVLNDKTDRIENKMIELVEHQKTMNGKVARHEVDITEMKVKNIQEAGLVSVLIDEKKERDQDMKTSNKKWKERMVWLGILLVVLVLSKIGLISTEIAGIFK